MIPYVTTIGSDLGPISWSGALTILAVFLGIAITRWRAGRLGYDPHKLDSFIWWMLVGAFIGGHALGDLLYHPSKVLREPWTLLYVWRDQSSYPGFFGCLMGGLSWKWIRGGGKPIMAFSEVIISVFPISWVFGRLGCALAHDHPGKAASGPLSFLAVRYPAGNVQGIPAGPHWNLGLLEMLYAGVISIVCVVMWSRRRAVGTFVGTVLLLYTPVRFLLDFLRVGDPTYLGLTPGQYFSIGFFALGGYALLRSRSGAFESTFDAVRAEPSSN